jgi:DNA-binding transcriptional ArsR family regulator
MYDSVERRSGGGDRRAMSRDDNPGRRAADLPTTQQRKVLLIIERYVDATGEACPASIVARKLALHHSTVQEHLRALFQKGWLRTPNAPAMPQPDVA